MAQLGTKLRTVEGGIAFFCPGCESAHVAPLKKPTGANWSWDGHILKPTIVPSIVTSVGARRCHCLVKGGQIQFFGDSTHGLAGKTVPLPDLPPHMRDP